MLARFDDGGLDEIAGFAVRLAAGGDTDAAGNQTTVTTTVTGTDARGSSNLHLTRNDLSHNWKQRLHSLIEHESLLDWMSYHQNEKDEWLQFGGAIYLVLGDLREALAREGLQFRRD